MLAPTMSDRILSMVMPRLAQAGELLLSPLGLLPLRPEASIVYPRQMAGQGDPNREQGRATSLEKVDEIVLTLQSRAQHWSDLDLERKADLLESCLENIWECTESVIEVTLCQKGRFQDNGGEEGIGWASAAWALRETIDVLRNGGIGLPPTSIRTVTAADGRDQHICTVFPRRLVERLLFAGFSAQVHVKHDQPVSQDLVARKHGKGAAAAMPPRVGGVLGAGNLSIIPLLDIVHMLVMENATVVCKMNQVNEYCGPLLEKILAPLIERQYVSIIYGGVEVGSAICTHKAISLLHMTGSAATYNAIVWGQPLAPSPSPDKPAPCRARRIDIPFTAELGNITPTILVPGKWTVGQLRYHAHQIVAGVAHNTSADCCATKIIVTSRRWPQRRQFLAILRQELNQSIARGCWYPGSMEKYKKFEQCYPDCLRLGACVDVGALPFLFKEELDIDTATEDEHAFNQEPWSQTLTEAVISNCDYEDIPSFMEKAARFVNTKVMGSLCCCLIIDPATQARHQANLEAMISRLQYGSVVVNVTGHVAFGFPQLGWGAHGENSAHAIGSGIGLVHNVRMIDNVEKSVLIAPFQVYPKPLWFHDLRNGKNSWFPVMKALSMPRLTLAALSRVFWAVLQN